jgi:hypothetical protein
MTYQTALGPYPTELQELLWPYYAVHRISWRRLLDGAGVTGWTITMRQLYHTMAASRPLLDLAGMRATQLGRDYQSFIDWCSSHAAEEEPHADWLLEDLETIGIQGEQVKESVAHPDVLALIGAQFAIAQSRQPTGILGYLFIAECHPVDPERLKAFAVERGLPSQAMNTLLFHAVEDREHMKEIIALIDHYADNTIARRAMEASAVAYLTGWTRFFGSVLATCKLAVTQ